MDRSKTRLRLPAWSWRYADLHVAVPLACACRYALLCTMCPAVRNNGHSAPTIQSCALVAPEWAVQVLVWSPCKSMQCFLQLHLTSGLTWWRGREESTGTSKPSVVETKVAHRFGSKSSLLLEGRMVPSHGRCVCLLLQDLVQRGFQ
jgi:hypothetical protein